MGEHILYVNVYGQVGSLWINPQKCAPLHVSLCLCLLIFGTWHIRTKYKGC